MDHSYANIAANRQKVPTASAPIEPAMAKSLEVPAALGNIDSAIDRMDSMLSKLRQRLEPALRDPETECDESRGDRAAFSAPLAEAIQRSADRIEQFNAVLSALINRLEV